VYLGPPEARELTPVDSVAQQARLSASVRQLAGALHDATVVPLQKVRQPGPEHTVIGGTQVFLPLELTRRFDSASGNKRFMSQSELYVATPAMLRYLGIDSATVGPRTDFLVDRSVRTDGLVIPDMASRTQIAVTNVQRIDVGEHLFGSAAAGSPANFITLGALRRHGWDHIPAGWLVQSSRPLTSDRIADARQVAADAGLTIEVEDKGTSYAKVMAIAIGAGAILALAILAMTVGLIRSESAGDLRTLTATGATSGIRRTLTATTAGALALLGAVLGVAGAYVVLVATYHDDLGYLRHVPVLWLAVALVGVPLAAAAAGWLVAGREPRTIGRAVVA
jgi:putative ABC transport system permease protein